MKVSKYGDFWSVFSRIRTEYRDLLRKSPYSVLILKNTDQKKLRIWTLCTVWLKCNVPNLLKHFPISIHLKYNRKQANYCFHWNLQHYKKKQKNPHNCVLLVIAACVFRLALNSFPLLWYCWATAISSYWYLLFYLKLVSAIF